MIEDGLGPRRGVFECLIKDGSVVQAKMGCFSVDRSWARSRECVGCLIKDGWDGGGGRTENYAVLGPSEGSGGSRRNQPSFINVSFSNLGRSWEEPF